jgi:hypothetical protein
MQPTSLAPTSVNPAFRGPGIQQLGIGQIGLPASLPVVPVALTLPEKFPLNLDAQQSAALVARVEKFEFAALPLQDFSTLSQQPTMNLNRALDAFMTRINKAENPQLFKLVDKLTEKLEEEKIGDLAIQILDAKPGPLDRALGFFSKKKLQQSLDSVLEELGKQVRLKSKNLSDVVVAQEKQLITEMNKLNEELRNLEAVKGVYFASFVEFCEEVVFLNSALAKAKAQAPALLAAADKDVMRAQDIQDKLQALESVALSREAMMTRLPGEALILRQIQNAGAQTLLELSTTMGDRFASIRMTLIGLHGANLVRNVQRLGQANANLDNQLQEARAKLTGVIVAASANAPGDNRVQQANNLKRAVNDVALLQDITDKAREDNRAKFEEARNTMAQVRDDMLTLSQRVSPGAAVAARTY